MTIAKKDMAMLSRVTQGMIDFYSRLVPSKQTATLEDFCCVSIGAADICFAYVSKRNKKTELLLCESFPCQEQSFHQPLARFVKKYRLEGMSCSWVLRPEEYQLLLHEALPVLPSEFQSAIRWTLKDLLRIPAANAVIDSFPVVAQKAINAKPMIMVAAALSTHLQQVSEKIRETGLDLNVIDLTDLGLRNIAALFEREEKSAALIYINGTAGKLLMTYEKNLCFMRHLHNDMFAQNDNTLDEIALEIQRSLDYYQNQWRQQTPSRIIIASTAPELTAGLGKRLDLSVEQCDLTDCLIMPRRQEHNTKNL